MPRYSLVCPKCGVEYEKSCSIAARKEQICKIDNAKLKLRPVAPMLVGFDNLGRSI